MKINILCYNAFIRTTDHCKVQTAFVSLFNIFINMKPWNASYSSVVVGRPRPLGHLTNFFTNFFNFGKFVKIREFFCWGNEFSIYGNDDYKHKLQIMHQLRNLRTH